MSRFPLPSPLPGDLIEVTAEALRVYPCPLPRPFPEAAQGLAGELVPCGTRAIVLTSCERFVFLRIGERVRWTLQSEHAWTRL